MILREQSGKYYGMAPTTREYALALVGQAARVCYQSEKTWIQCPTCGGSGLVPTFDELKDEPGPCPECQGGRWKDSDDRLIEKVLLGRGHTSVLEHSNICFKSPATYDFWNWLFEDDRSFFRIFNDPLMPHGTIISGNMRAWLMLFRKKPDYVIPAFVERFPLIFSEFENRANRMKNPMRSHPNMRITAWVQPDEQKLITTQNPWADLPILCFLFDTSRAVTHELVRHRMLQFSQESTRYVPYEKGSHVTYMAPSFIDDLDQEALNKSLLEAENSYCKFRNDGATPGQARIVLPQALKAQIFVSGRLSAWINFVMLRDSTLAYSEIRELGAFVREKLEAEGFPVQKMVDDLKKLQTPDSRR